jgi:SOS-response transcriptional repressor LexA
MNRTSIGEALATAIIQRKSPSYIQVDENVPLMDELAHIPYTHREGQYLAFIHYYSKVNGLPPAEADMQRFFNASPPSVHQMILRLDKKGLIERVPGKARTIRNVLEREELPDLE